MLSPSVAGRLMGRIRRPADRSLSKREREVLALVADGTTNREAARRLFVSEAAIKTHLLHIYDKLGVRDRAAAVGEAYKRGLLPCPSRRRACRGRRAIYRRRTAR